ncbi:murein transglycosylase A [Sphingomonas sp. XXL09]|uniref:murein transglycosylase A n=1 Tax=Sphingomonas sp. XXL09 TaxID=3457787 RepID=UPI00406BBC7E
MIGKRVTGSIALALALSACGGRVVPLTTERPPVRGEERPRPMPPRPTSAGQVIASGRGFDGRIAPATPLLATPVQPLPGATTAAAAGVVPGPAIDTLPITEAQAEAARQAFLTSCPGLMRRTDTSGLTRGADWQTACAAARSVARGGARDFFITNFEAVQVGDGRAFATGYYEPEIAASRERRPGYEVPIYARPDDLIDVDLGQFSADLKGKKIRGRVDGKNLIPYYDRAAIVGGAIERRAPVLAWGADEAAVFFLQVQGSGRLRLPNGDVIRIGYDSQNGRDYTGIGALMKARGLIGPGQTSMQGIVAWLRANPEQGRAIMNENKSFVFFREIDTPPLGAMGYVVNGGISAAVDTKFVPLGAPVFLSMDRQDATGLWVAQDTGGAIKGANRFDTFWGAGPVAEATAGGMAARGTAFVLLPIGTLSRMQTGAPAQP